VRERDESNFKLSVDGRLRPAAIGGVAGLTYRWDGLYQGESVAVARPGWIHLWSVTFLEREDVIVRDFGRVLERVTFATF
jgi:hypothetical protein